MGRKNRYNPNGIPGFSHSTNREIQELQDAARKLNMKVPEAQEVVEQQVQQVEAYNDSWIKKMLAQLAEKIAVNLLNISKNSAQIQELWGQWLLFQRPFMAYFDNPAAMFSNDGSDSLKIKKAFAYHGTSILHSPTDFTVPGLLDCDYQYVYLTYNRVNGVWAVRSFSSILAVPLLPPYNGNDGLHYIPVCIVERDTDDVRHIRQLTVGPPRLHEVELYEFYPTPYFQTLTDDVPDWNQLQFSGNIIAGTSIIPVVDEVITVFETGYAYADITPLDETDWVCTIEKQTDLAVHENQHYRCNLAHVYCENGRIIDVHPIHNQPIQMVGVAF
ncbi:hypothetical protein BVY04_03755 [bacterium M21]|nr:hypothetical protein BVY04_03755 [bacterium M21]